MELDTTSKNFSYFAKLKIIVLLCPLNGSFYPNAMSSEGKESACNVGDLGSIPRFRRSPGGGHGNPLQYSCLVNPPGKRSLVGYSPWSHKEPDTTERPSTHDLGTLCIDHLEKSGSFSFAVQIFEALTLFII